MSRIRSYQLCLSVLLIFLIHFSAQGFEPAPLFQDLKSPEKKTRAKAFLMLMNEGFGYSGKISEHLNSLFPGVVLSQMALEALPQLDERGQSLLFWTLGKHPTFEMVPALLDMYKQMGRNSRQREIQGILAQISDPRFFSFLLSPGFPQEEEFSTLKLRLLGQFQAKEALDELLKKTFNDSPSLRSEAIQSLKQFKEKAVIDRCIQMIMEDPSHECKTRAIETLGQIGDRAAIGTLLRILERGQFEGFREKAAQSLLALKAYDEIFQCMESERHRLREIVSTVLRVAWGTYPVGLFARLLHSPNRQVRYQARYIIEGKNATATLDLLIDQLSKEDEVYIKENFVKVIKDMSDPKAVLFMQSLMTHPDSKMRQICLNGFGWEPSPTIPLDTQIDFLQTWVESTVEESDARLKAAQILEKMSHPRIKSIFLNLLNDKERKLRNLAAMVIGRNGTPVDFDLLVDLAKRSTDIEFREYVISGLRRIGDPRAISLLIEKWNDSLWSEWDKYRFGELPKSVRFQVLRKALRDDRHKIRSIAVSCFATGPAAEQWPLFRDVIFDESFSLTDRVHWVLQLAVEAPGFFWTPLKVILDEETNKKQKATADESGKTPTSFSGLLAAFQKENDTDRKSTLAFTILAYKDPAFYPYLVSFLPKASYEMKRLLPYRADSGLFQFAAANLASQTPEVRKALIEMLASVNAPGLIDSLCGIILEDGDPEVRFTAVGILGSSGNFRACPPLRKVLKFDPAGKVRAAAARALGWFADFQPEIIDDFSRCLDKDHFTTESAVADAAKHIVTLASFQRLFFCFRKAGAMNRERLRRVIQNVPAKGFSEWLAQRLAISPIDEEKSLILEVLDPDSEPKCLEIAANILSSDPNPLLRKQAAAFLEWEGRSEVVEILLKALPAESSPEVRGAIMTSLHSRRNPCPPKFLQSIVDNPRPEIRKLGVELLHLLKEEFLPEKLAHIAHTDPDLTVRLTALEVLTQFTLTASVSEKLIPLLDADPEPRIRTKTAKTLKNSNSIPARDALIKALGYDPNLEVKVQAAKALACFKEHVVTEALLRNLTQKDEKVRSQIVATLGFLQDPEALPTLVGIMKGDLQVEMRQAAVRAIGRLPEEASFPFLKQALLDADAAVRQIAGECLQGMPHGLLQKNVKNLLTETFPAAREVGIFLMRKSLDHGTNNELYKYAIQDPCISVRLCAVKALGKRGQIDLLKSLVEKSQQEPEEFRMTLAETLGFIRNSEAVPCLELLLRNDPSPRVREATIFSLALFGDETVICLLEYALEDRDQNVRHAAEQVIAVSRSPSVLNIIRKKLASPQVTTRLEMLSILRMKNDKEYVEELLALFRNDPDPPVKSAAFQVIVSSPHPKAIEELFQIAMQADSSFSGKAEIALEGFSAPGTLDVSLSFLRDKDLGKSLFAAQLLWKNQDERGLEWFWDSLGQASSRANSLHLLSSVDSFQHPKTVFYLMRSLFRTSDPIVCRTILEKIRTIGLGHIWEPFLNDPFEFFPVFVAF